MLGFFGFQKIIVLIAIVAAVWYGFKWWNRMQEVRDAEPKAAPKSKPSVKVEDMEKCTACGAFVAAGSRSCGRGNCPYPG